MHFEDVGHKTRVVNFETCRVPGKLHSLTLANRRRDLKCDAAQQYSPARPDFADDIGHGRVPNDRSIVVITNHLVHPRGAPRPESARPARRDRIRTTPRGSPESKRRKGHFEFFANFGHPELGSSSIGPKCLVIYDVRSRFQGIDERCRSFNIYDIRWSGVGILQEKMGGALRSYNAGLDARTIQ